MNQSLLVSVKREDFGFVVSRFLAVVVWILGARNLVDLTQRLIPAFRDSDRGYLLRTFETRSPTIIYVIALGYLGYRLWTQGHSLGRSTTRSGGNSAMVLASQALLLCGLAMGSAIYLLVHASQSIVAWTIWLAQSDVGKATTSLASGGFVAAVFDILLGAAIFGWGYSTAGKVRLPDFEYDPGEATEPDGPA